MRKCSLLKLLRWKVISVLIVFTGALVGYFHIMSLQAEDEKNIQRIAQITSFLAEKAPPELFAQIPSASADASSREKLQPALQSLLSDLCLPLDFIRYGYYSANNHNIVAFGPLYERSMLQEIDPNRLAILRNNTGEKLYKEDSATVWYGSKALTYIRPIWHNGQIVGQAFTSINRDCTDAFVLRHTIAACIGAVFMLLACIAIYCEFFLRFQKDVSAYADALLKGEDLDYASRVPEFAPFIIQINQQMKEMTRLDRLNFIGEMAAGIAHEVRNPLTTVRGLLQLLSAKKQLEPYHGKFDLMISEIDSANTVITEFLSLAKDKAMHFLPTDLNQIVRDVLPIFDANAVHYHPKLKVLLDLKDLPLAPMDAHSVRQLVCNLVRNAFEAMPNGGAVTIHTAPTETGVRLSVEDEGCGIATESIEKIGTPFFTTKETGTGLGLAICNRVALRHQADVRIENNPEKGATFTFLFPLERKEETAPKEVRS